MVNVSRLASVLKKKFNIQKGDRVLIYMPMVIEAAFAMLACARIGATHSVVFGGFAAKELASRIDDCTPKLIILASTGLEPGKRIPYAPIVDEALSYCQKVDGKSMPRLIKQRQEMNGELKSGELNKMYYDYDELFNNELEQAECVSLPSTHPLYILYTSGTTG
jgi:propionyl-CoA synthetase